MTKTVADLEEEIADLKEEIDFLKRAIRGDKDEDLSGQISQKLRVSAQKSRLLFRLYKANGKPVASYPLLLALSQDATNYEREENFVRVLVHQTNRAFGLPLVKNVRSFGYYLTPDGMGIVEKALAGA